jgi:hypothetical protein
MQASVLFRSTAPRWLLVGLCCAALSLSAPPGPAEAAPAAPKSASRKLREGQSLHQLLRQLGVSGPDCQKAARALKPLLDLSQRARPGDSVHVVLGARRALVSMVYHSQRHGSFVVKRRGDRLVASRGGQAPSRGEEADREEVKPLQGPPAWLLPSSPDPRFEPLRAWQEATPDARPALALALEREHGLDGLRALLAEAYAPPPRAPGVHERVAVLPSGHAVPFVVYVPQGYSPDAPLPLHISLHGLGGDGPGTCRLRWGEAPPGVLLACPTHPGGQWHGDLGQEKVQGVYRQLLHDFAVQTDQVVLGGFSNGAIGTWHIGARFPWLWSALVPRSGAALAQEFLREDLLHLPILITHGTADHSIAVSHARQMVELLSASGNTPRYIEVQGGGHDFFSDLNPEIIDWMLAQRRSPPTHVRYHLRADSPERVYWMRAQGEGPLEARIEHSHDQTQVILTTARPLTWLELFLPPALFPEDRPVQVLLNGHEVFAGPSPPQAEALLESFSLTGALDDSATRRIILPLPPPP